MAAKPVSSLNQALEIIHRAHLPYPDGELLECFLRDSVEPELAALHVLQRCSNDKNGPDLTLLLSDWKHLVAAFSQDFPDSPPSSLAANVTSRDGGKCCLTGLGSSFWDPLVVRPILPLPKIQTNKAVVNMLDAFVGRGLREGMLSTRNKYKDYWLVRDSAATAMSQGFFQVKVRKGSGYSVAIPNTGGPTRPRIVEKTAILRFRRFSDLSSSGMETPDIHVLQARSRFAKAIRWTFVAQDIRHRKARKVSDQQSSLLSLGFMLFLRLVVVILVKAGRLLPAYVRMRAYDGLACLGSHLYGPSCSLDVQRLPFGMYLKRSDVDWHEALANEYGALKLVRRHTKIPVPRPLDLVSNSRTSYLLTSTLPGVRLGACIDVLSEEEKEKLVCDLRECSAQLQAIPKKIAPGYAITNALGEACHDHRVNAALNSEESGGGFVGPFVDEDEFNKTIQVGALPQVSHQTGHRIVFTHSDLNMRNVLIHNGRLSGIVDWENSGWYPEYWDYTKAHYITKLKQRWLGIVDDVFKARGNYERELATERQIWHYCF